MKKTLITIAMVLFPAASFAADLGTLQAKELAKVSSVEFNDYNDATLMNIKYVGSATQAVVAITLDAFTTQAPIGTTDLNLDMSAAAYDTLGELCDAINADADYVCTLIDGKRDDDSSITTNITAAVTTDAKAVGGYYTVGIDTGSALSDGSIQYINRVGMTPNSGKSIVLKYCNAQVDGAGTLNIYGKLKKYESVSGGPVLNDSTLVASIPLADDTAKTAGNVYGGPWIEFAADAHVVVSAGNATTEQTSTSYLECYWDEK